MILELGENVWQSLTSSGSIKHELISAVTLLLLHKGDSYNSSVHLMAVLSTITIRVLNMSRQKH